MSRLSQALSDVACVVHMAGPFAVTSSPMLSACVATRTNYMDITGEIEVFERVTEERTNELIRYETVGTRGLTAHWEISFATGSAVGETEVRSVMKTPLGRLGIAALALMGKSPAEEQAANLHRLKQILETGRVTHTRHAVAGKFGNA
jgi:hypothetical protein